MDYHVSEVPSEKRQDKGALLANKIINGDEDEDEDEDDDMIMDDE